MDIQNIILYVVAFLDLLLGILIIRKNYKSEINIAYSLFVFFVILWTFGIAFFRQSDNPESLLFWNREFILTAILIAISFLHFSLVFPYVRKPLTMLKRIGLYSSSLVVIIALMIPGTLIRGIAVRDWGNESILGWGYLYYGAFFGLLSVIAFVILLRKLNESTGLRKAQIFYVLAGLAISLAFGAFFNLVFILFGNYRYIWLGPYSSFIMLAFISYSIIAYRLMDIKMVLRKYAVYSFALVSVILPAVGILHLFSFYFHIDNISVNIAVLFLVLVFFPIFKNFFFNIANKYFFSSLYDSREVITKISDQLRSTLEVDRIYEIIYNILARAFHFKSFAILNFNEATNKFITNFNYQFDFDRKKSLFDNENFQKLMLAENRPILLSELERREDLAKLKPTIDLLRQYNTELLVPLSIKGKTIGLILFGRKESGDMYNQEDFRVLNIISSQVAIAIENAMLYKSTKDFNLKLKKEVERATGKLKRANDELKQLDKAKSEFISIASHQLRTPLTAIKGYVSMILDKDFGKISKKVEKPLKDVYASNERLIELINNLLDVSRIESGRLKLTFEEVQLEEIVESVYGELTGIAKEKGLNFIYEKPKQALPRVNIDVEKVRQVVMNIIDNALKYTEQGEVEVILEKHGRNLFFCVQDTGRGISESDLLNLFKKFSRGEGTSVIHTEGTGLGLYVAKQMIEIHKGKIWAESDGEWKGSRFCFTLPTV